MTDFTDVTSDVELAALLSTAYGGDIDNLDALTGGLAESATPKSGSMLGELFHAAWIEQLNRSIVGDRMHHLHKRPIEDLRQVAVSRFFSGALSGGERKKRLGRPFEWV